MQLSGKISTYLREEDQKELDETNNLQSAEFSSSDISGSMSMPSSVSSVEEKMIAALCSSSAAVLSSSNVDASLTTQSSSNSSCSSVEVKVTNVV
jgi:hypothetical protein